MRNLCLRFSCLFILAAPLFGTDQSQSTQPTPEKSKRLVSEAWSRIDRGFYDPKMNGVDWGAVKLRYLESCVAVKTWEELYDLVDEMVAELHSSHAAFVPAEDPRRKTRAHFTGFHVCKLESGQYAIRSIDADSPNAKGDLKPGMIINKVDDAPTQEHVEDLRRLIRRRVGSPGIGAVEGLVSKFFFHGPADRPVQVEAQAPDGTMITVSLSRYPETARPRVEARRINDKTGYLFFSAWIAENRKQIFDALEAFKDMDALIVDVRDNSGGDDEPTWKITSAFFEPNIPWGYWVDRSGKRTDFFTTSSPIRFNGKLAVLINERSASASENFANFVQETRRGKLFGQITAGALTATRWDKVTGGRVGYPHRLQFSFNDKRIEGVGVKPDEVVNWSVEDLVSGRDPVVEAATRFLAGHR